MATPTDGPFRSHDRVADAGSDRRDIRRWVCALRRPNLASESLPFGMVAKLGDVLVGEILGESAVHQGAPLSWIR